MAKYGVALGGNKRNWPWDNMYASANTAGNIGYAAHLMTRHKGLPFVFDGCADDWGAYFQMEVPTGSPVIGDQFITHWINEGTNIEAIYIHNKRAASAVDSTGAAAPTTVNLVIRDAAGAVVGAPTAIDLTVPGFTKIEVDTLLQTNSTVELELTGGDFKSGCFAIHVDLFNAFDEHPCVCCVPTCDVPTPEPICFNPTPGC